MARQIQVSQPDLSFREFLATFQVLKSTRLTQGKQVRTFEDDFKSYLGIKHAYALNSGTSALVLSLMALGVKYGDEVIVPNFTFGATVNAVLLVGAKPILVDVDPKTFALDPIKILEAITSRTKVIIVVHLFGLPAEMSELLKIARKNGLRVVEDVAQALGSEIENKNKKLQSWMEDERHVIFKCCRYDAIRSDYQHLFTAMTRDITVITYHGLCHCVSECK